MGAGSSHEKSISKWEWWKNISWGMFYVDCPRYKRHCSWDFALPKKISGKSGICMLHWQQVEFLAWKTRAHLLLDKNTVSPVSSFCLSPTFFGYFGYWVSFSSPMHGEMRWDEKTWHQKHSRRHQIMGWRKRTRKLIPDLQIQFTIRAEGKFVANDAWRGLEKSPFLWGEIELQAGVRVVSFLYCELGEGWTELTVH